MRLFLCLQLSVYTLLPSDVVSFSVASCGGKQTSALYQETKESSSSEVSSSSSKTKNVDSILSKNNNDGDDDTSSSSSSIDCFIAHDFEEQTSMINKENESKACLHRRVLGPTEVLIYDTSLRDGTQGESVSVSCDDKLKIATQLSKFGVDFVEAGWPGSNPKDAEFFSRAKTELSMETRQKLVAFGSTRRKNIDVAKDGQIQALVDAEVPTVCIVAKAHLWQVTDIIRATPEENLSMIYDSVAHLNSLGKQVFVDLEHFFDGYKFNKDYALQCCNVAVEAGVSGIVLCDTNGGSMPWEVKDITSDIVGKFGDVTIGMHAHNDCGMAVANSLSAAKGGAGMIQGTINGIGERTGNADLCSIVPSLSLHMDSHLACNNHLHELTGVSRFVDETLNRKPNSASPFVGASAFAHKGGLHVAAMERSPLSYQHIDPSLVGNEKRILISELSGRQNIIGKMRENGMDTKIDGSSDFSSKEDEENLSKRATAILNRVKELESIGYTFEGAEASVDLMILHSTVGYCPPFRLLDYSTQVFESQMNPENRLLSRKNVGDAKSSSFNTITARATIKVQTVNFNEDDIMDTPFIERLEVSDGNGPVDALAKALQRALIPSHPNLKNVVLSDYKVRILDPGSATEAATRVMIEFHDTEQDTSWTTVSVDRNIISASLNALVDGFEYALIEYAQSCMLCDEFYIE